MSAPLLFTSHWRSPLLRDVDAVVVSISRGEPRWSLPFRYRRARFLAPDDATWACKDEDAFLDSYLHQLEGIGLQAVLKRLEGVAEGRPVVLLCWERDPSDPATPCHRRDLAGWLEAKSGIEVPELRPGDLPRRGDSVDYQQKLFEEES